MTPKKILYIVIALGFISFISCNNIKEVSFKMPVDTSTKRIKLQNKQTYELTDIGIYASNEFDGARLNGFKKENDSTAFVIINPENIPINNSAYYAFKIWSDTSIPFYLTFQYPKGYKHRYIPKLKIANTWQLIDPSSVYKKDSIVTIKLNLNTYPITVAAQEINSYTDVKNWYTDLVVGKEDYVKVKSAGKSKLGRDLPVLDIYKGDAKNKDIIVLLTRQHPPEVTGYIAFQYFLQKILDDSSLSQKFLKNYRVLAFPIMNPDGVDLGHWRHNASGVDTNRDWSSYQQPEIRQTVKFINRTLRKNKSTLLLGLDFHSTWHDVFYTNTKRKETSLPNFIDNWFVAIENNIPNYKVNEKPGNSKKPVSKGWFLNGHRAVGITYEIGDHTPSEKIKIVGSVTAEQMMNILLNNQLLTKFN